MNFLLDENISKRLAIWLKEQGYEAITLQKLNLLGIKNGSVAELAIQENAIILTCDRVYPTVQKARMQSCHFFTTCRVWVSNRSKSERHSPDSCSISERVMQNITR
jgi:hypothetical protein